MAKKTYSPSFKFNAVLDTYRTGGTDAEVARQHGIHPVTLASWKRFFLEHGHEMFSGRDSDDEYERRIAELERMLGQKEVELALMRNFSKAR